MPGCVSDRRGKRGEGRREGGRTRMCSIMVNCSVALTLTSFHCFYSFCFHNQGPMYMCTVQLTPAHILLPLPPSFPPCFSLSSLRRKGASSHRLPIAALRDRICFIKLKLLVRLSCPILPPSLPPSLLTAATRLEDPALPTNTSVCSCH